MTFVKISHLVQKYRQPPQVVVMADNEHSRSKFLSTGV